MHALIFIIVLIQTMKLKQCTASVNLPFQNLMKVCAVYMAFKIKFADRHDPFEIDLLTGSLC